MIADIEFFFADDAIVIHRSEGADEADGGGGVLEGVKRGHGGRQK